jgi:hypothetical protein
MGKSDKPDIEYRFFDHVKYIEGFINKGLTLSNLGNQTGAIVYFDKALAINPHNIGALYGQMFDSVVGYEGIKRTFLRPPLRKSHLTPPFHSDLTEKVAFAISGLFPMEFDVCSYFLQTWAMGFYEDSTLDVSVADVAVTDEATSSSMTAAGCQCWLVCKNLRRIVRTSCCVCSLVDCVYCN